MAWLRTLACVCGRVAAGLTVLVAALGAVFTREAMRGRGLAGTVVAGDALDRARAAGAALALVSGDGPLYRRLGFTPASGRDRLGLPGPAGSTGQDAPQLRRGDAVDLRLAIENDIPLLARIYDAEPVRFARDAADWRELLRASVVFAWPGQIRVVTAAGAPAGYLAVTRTHGGACSSWRATEMRCWPRRRRSATTSSCPRTIPRPCAIWRLLLGKTRIYAALRASVAATAPPAIADPLVRAQLR